MLWGGVEGGVWAGVWSFPRWTGGLALGVAALALGLNPAVAFGAGLAVAWLLRRWRPDLVAQEGETDEEVAYLCSQDGGPHYQAS